MSKEDAPGEIYLSMGTTGAMGHGAHVENMVVAQQSSSLKTLSEQEILRLRQLADQLVRALPAGLEVAEAVAGYNALNELVEAAEALDPQKQQKAISSWKHWLSSIGDKSQGVISFAANLVTIALPWMKALGLS